MKILHTVENYYPSTGGMQEVVKQISERLLKLGHDVSVATSRHPKRKEKKINEVKIIEFNIKGKMVEGLSGEIDVYKKFLINSNFDIITNFAAQQWATDIMLPLLDRIKAKKVFVPTGFSALYNPEYKKYFESMISWMKKYDMNIFLSNDYRDINFARTNGIKKIMVIPNGASEKEFLMPKIISIRKKFNIPDNYFFILHVGSHTGSKGHREAIEIFKKSKITHAVFLIVGNEVENGCKRSCGIREKLLNLSPMRMKDKKKLIISTLTRQDTVDAYKEADFFLFPSNIECSPLVLYECMASKTPFLTTDVGNSKEIIKWSNGGGELLPTKINKHGYSFADINLSANLLTKLNNSPSKRKMMAENGFKVWSKNFTWEKITRDYEKLYLLIKK